MDLKAGLAALCICLAAAGCSPLAPQPDRSTFFLLTPLPAGSAAVTPSTVSSGNASLVIGVGPIDFPSYLRRPEVITRTAPNQIVLSQEKQWAEPLDRNFTRVLAENLARLLDTRQIEQYPWPLRTRIDYQVIVRVERFETTSDGQPQMAARWTIRDGRDGHDLYGAETIASSSLAAGPASASAALSTDLATLSRAIASRIAELTEHRASTAGRQKSGPNRRFSAATPS